MRCCRASLLALVLTLLPAPSGAAILFVKPDAPGPVHDGMAWATAFRSIQPALDAAQPDDVIRVVGGTYRESVSFPRPRLALRGGYAGTESGADPTPGGPPSTILGLEPETPVVFFPPDAIGCGVRGFTVLREMPGLEAGIRVEATDVLIEDVTVRGIGQPGGWGGGIAFWPFSGGTVRGCLIEGNTAREGAGIRVLGATVDIERNVIRKNRAEDTIPGRPDFATVGQGGGISSVAGTITLHGNTVSGNRAWEGGGLFVSGTATITNNVIDGNIAEKPVSEWPNDLIVSRGGGVSAWGLAGHLRNNLVTNNRAVASPDAFDTYGASGGGLAIQGGSVDVVNNTIANNIAHTSEGRGWSGGMAATTAGVVANNIIAHNQSDSGSEIRPVPYPPRTIHTNLFYGNLPADTNGRLTVDAYGNIVADPMFSDGYHLSPGSPAIDGGEDSFVQPEDTDMDGGTRVKGRRVDIGAYEASAAPAPPRIHVSTQGNDAHDGTSWAKAKRTISAGARAVGRDGEVWVARGTYPPRPFLFSHVALYGGFAGGETDRAGRDPRSNETILDGEETGPVLYISSMLTNVTLDGFTIRNGKRQYGGAGIQSYGRNITISHNVIENNVAWDFEVVAGAEGGGIVAGLGPITISHNVIRANSASASLDGPPMFVSQAYARGGGVSLFLAEVAVQDNLFIRNVAWAAGAGPVWANGSALSAYQVTGTISGNTICESLSPYPGAALFITGEAVYLRNCGTDLTFANNTIAFNEAGYTQMSSDVVPRNNAFFANVRGHAFGVPDPVSLQGNLAADPFFVNRAAGDYRLSVGSPTIDAGDDSVVRPGQTDLDGRPRILGAHVDIGAYEFAPGSGLTLGHAAWALRVAAGLAEAGPSALSILDAAGQAGQVDFRDVVEIARRVSPS